MAAGDGRDEEMLTVEPVGDRAEASDRADDDVVVGVGVVGLHHQPSIFTAVMMRKAPKT